MNTSEACKYVSDCCDRGCFIDLWLGCGNGKGTGNGNENGKRTVES